MKRKIGILFAYLVIVFFVFFPETVCQGAKTGLLLWFQTVLPALLPFMIVSGFFVKKNITDSINKMAYRKRLSILEFFACLKTYCKNLANKVKCSL